jgi:hypothetical protein
MNPVTYVCRITRYDIIEFINDPWIRFADENAAPTLALEVIGTLVWQHILGMEIRQLYRELVAKVRETHSQVDFSFRCDSPAVRRFMRMRVVSLPHDAVEFSSWVEREEPYERPVRLLDPTIARDRDDFLRMCSWCKSIDVAGSWLEVEQAIEKERLFDRPRLPQISHGICPACLAEERRILHGD